MNPDLLLLGFPCWPNENLYSQEVIERVAEGIGLKVYFDMLDNHWLNISVPVPQTSVDFCRNHQFWQWFFNASMRNLGLIGCVFECVFVDKWEPEKPVEPSWIRSFFEFLFGFRKKEEKEPAKGIIFTAKVGQAISVFNGIKLRLEKDEFERLRDAGVYLAKSDEEGYYLELRGNITEVKLKI